jgi:crossover junction endodeoxyribonuclease RuvC
MINYCEELHMKILGIDPGTARMGWGIIEVNGSIVSSNLGAFETSKAILSHPQRLLVLYNGLLRKMRDEQPDVVAVERLFFNHNVRTAMSVGEGRAMVMLAAAQARTKVGEPIEVVEYTALTAKLTLVGHGRADKKLMIEAVRKILGLSDLESNLQEKGAKDDAADALAMALTHYYKLTGQAAEPIEIEKKVSAASKSVAKKNGSKLGKSAKGADG